MRDYVVIYEEGEDGGWGAYLPDLPGVVAPALRVRRSESASKKRLLPTRPTCAYKADRCRRRITLPVRPEFVWAALDCPSGLVTNTFNLAGRILLGRLAVDLLSPVPGVAEYVLASWPIGHSGRKLSTGSALFSDSGELHAVARAVWIEVAE